MAGEDVIRHSYNYKGSSIEVLRKCFCLLLIPIVVSVLHMY